MPCSAPASTPSAKGKKASDALKADFDAYNANNCGTASQMGTTCQDTYNDIQDRKSEGDRANTMLFAVGLPVTIVGAAVLAAVSVVPCCKRLFPRRRAFWQQRADRRAAAR